MDPILPQEVLANLDDVNPLHLYTGRDWDADAELYYYRARSCDSSVGQFIEMEPVAATC